MTLTVVNVNEIEDKFGFVVGRQPTDAEVARLYRLRDQLKLNAEDPLWLLILALEHYQVLYEKIPSKIKAASKEHLENVQELSDAAMDLATASAKLELTKAVAKAAEEAADTTVKRKMLTWGLGSLTIAIILVGAFGFTIYSQARNAGFQAGLAAGYTEAKDEKAAAAWANTPDGQLAYKFAQAGDLRNVAHCLGNGWSIRNGVCYPFAAQENGKNMTYGWSIPETSPEPTDWSAFPNWDDFVDWAFEQPASE